MIVGERKAELSQNSVRKCVRRADGRLACWADPSDPYTTSTTGTEGRMYVLWRVAQMIRRCCGDLDGISAVRSRGDQLLRMPKKELAESVDCAVSFSFTNAVRL